MASIEQIANLILSQLQLIVALLALFVSFIALLRARVARAESTRPVVSAHLQSARGGNNALAYYIIVRNSGSSPAFNVRLDVSHRELSKALTTSALEQVVLDIHRTFSAEGVIPELDCGQSARKAFGLTGSSHPTWTYGARLAVTLTYRDGRGRRYSSESLLHVAETTRQSGGIWSLDSRPGAHGAAGA